MGDEAPRFSLLPGREQYSIEFRDAHGTWLLSLVYEKLASFVELGADFDYLLSVNGQAPIPSPYRVIRRLSFFLIAPQLDASWESDLGLIHPGQTRHDTYLTGCEGRDSLVMAPELRTRYEQAARFQLAFLMDHVAVDPDRKMICFETHDRTFAAGVIQPIGELGDLPLRLLRDDERLCRYTSLIERVEVMVREMGNAFWIGEQW